MAEDKRRAEWWRNALLAIGIWVPAEGRLRARITWRFFTVMGMAAGVAAVGMLGFAKYSTSPNFCNSCHIMAPYYEAWKTSRHSHVACVECHYPPGSPQTILWHKFQAMSQVVKYVTRTYSSKPFAEIEDASCLRSGCHSTRLLQGQVVSKSAATEIHFDHRPHLEGVRRDRELRCVSCHSQMVVGKHVEVTYDTCFLCHFKGRGLGRDLKPLGGCQGCHDVPAKNIKLGNMTYNHRDYVIKQKLSCQDCHLDVVRGDGRAPQERCFTCHNQPEKLKRYADGSFLHENHVTKHNVACFHCHEEIRHGFRRTEGILTKLNEPAPSSIPAPEDKAKGASVPALHEVTAAFECSYCHEAKHTGQRKMYSGDAAELGLPKMPSPMFRAEVDCIGCHYKTGGSGLEAEFKGKNFKASEQACVKCHGEKFKGVWQETHQELSGALVKLSQKIDAARAAAGSAADKEAAAKAKKSVETAARLERFVRLGRGDHNIYLASVALRKADAALNEAGTALKTQLTDLSAEHLLSGSYCATLCHEKVGVKVPPETVKAFGRKMPHKQHTEMMGCVKCHELGGHKNVPLKSKLKTAVCQECHPDWAN